jgi:SpoIIAA-like
VVAPEPATVEPSERPVIERIGGLADGVIGMRAVGMFSVDDYVERIEPEVDRLEAADIRLRLLLHLGPLFEGFGAGEWSELTRELRHTPFHKGAVVTDDGHIRTGLSVLRWALHGDVRSFANHEFDRAAAWVAR